MKISYRVENLRSLERTPALPLRPITILVGRNSAGKSTFLRSFSLMRQSLEARSSAPILWYGEYVDFGDYSAAVSYSDTKRDVSFSFEISDLETRHSDDSDISYFEEYSFFSHSRRKIRYENVQLSVSLGEQLGRTVRRGITLSIRDVNLSLSVKFARDGRVAEHYVVNGRDIADILPNHSVLFSASNIFSSPTLTTLARSDSKTVRRMVPTTHAFSSKIAEILKPLVDKRISQENIVLESRRILFRNVIDKEGLHQLSSTTNTKSFEKLYEKLASGGDNNTLDEIIRISLMNNSFTALSRVGEVLSEFFSATTYLGPARARSERYYRFQELEVSEISPDGQNIPVFLASLSDTEMSDFSAWVETLSGFGVGVKRDVGHISILLRREDFSVNVADTGYGVSQMLPVLAQIWWASRVPLRRKTSVSSTPLRPITMEQPELHLHPAHQAKLADAMLRALKMDGPRRGPSPVFLVETHSEALINRLGELIENRKLSAEDVQVVVFSADPSRDGRTIVETSEFNPDGSLINWPYGFFNY